MVKSHQKAVLHGSLPAGSAANTKCPRHFRYHCHHGCGVEVSCPHSLSCLALLLPETRASWRTLNVRVKIPYRTKQGVRADCGATPPAPRFSPPGLVAADTLPLATQAAPVSATITATASADLTSQPTLEADETEMDTTTLCCAVRTATDFKAAIDSEPPSQGLFPFCPRVQGERHRGYGHHPSLPITSIYRCFLSPTHLPQPCIYCPTMH